MNLVDKQHIAGVHIGEQRHQITGFLDGRPGGDAHGDAHLIGDDAGQRRFAEARRAVEQHMVQRLIAPFGGLDVDLQIALGLFLACVLPQQLWAQ